MKFVPDNPDKKYDLPLLNEAKAEDGWQGQQTKKSVEQLRADISSEIGRLGGTVTRFMRGMYHFEGEIERPGCTIEYTVSGPEGRAFQGRIDVAGLLPGEPYSGRKHHSSYDKTLRARQEDSVRMALFNVHQALRAARILEALSPGFAALIPWLLTDGSDKTFGEAWRIGMGTSGPLALPMPSDDGDIVEGEFREDKSGKK